MRKWFFLERFLLPHHFIRTEDDFFLSKKNNLLIFHFIHVAVLPCSSSSTFSSSFSFRCLLDSQENSKGINQTRCLCNQFALCHQFNFRVEPKENQIMIIIMTKRIIQSWHHKPERAKKRNIMTDQKKITKPCTVLKDWKTRWCVSITYKIKDYALRLEIVNQEKTKHWTRRAPAPTQCDCHRWTQYSRYIADQRKASQYFDSMKMELNLR